VNLLSLTGLRIDGVIDPLAFDDVAFDGADCIICGP